MKIGLGISVTMPCLFSFAPVEPPVDALVTPANLFTADQAAFNVSDHVNGRGNWSVTAGQLKCDNTDPGDHAAVSPDNALVAGNAHYAVYDFAEAGTGNTRTRFAGDGTSAYIDQNLEWKNFHWLKPADPGAAYTSMQFNPDGGYLGHVDNLRLFDLSSVDPHEVACDVILIGGDSNMSNAVSDVVTQANRETAYDPRIWYVPSLISGGRQYNEAQADGLEVMPAIEPVIGSSSAQRMSPCHAAAAEIVEWSAARGRPLIIMALGDPGSGFTGTKGRWNKSPEQSWLDQQSASDPHMYQEMLDMKAYLDGLGPDHEIVGMIWSLGANDTYSGDQQGHDNTRGPLYTQFFADVAADVADVPMVLVNIGSHYGAVGAAEMTNTLAKMDKDSGDALSVSNLTVIDPPTGNALNPGDASDPHYTAVGMQANGRLAGQTLLSLFSVAPATWSVAGGENQMTVSSMPSVTAPSVTGGENQMTVSG